MFGGVDGRWVWRNFFLDGNTFKDSPRVAKEPLVGEARVGVTLVLKRIEVTGALTWRTLEFETQKEADAFGSVVALLKF